MGWRVTKAKLILVVGAGLAVHLIGCAGSQIQGGRPGDAEMKALAALVAEVQEANGRSDAQAAKQALVKAQASLAQASNALVVHPRYMKVVTELSMAENVLAQAEWLKGAGPRVIEVTFDAKRAAEAAMTSRKARVDPSVWGRVVEHFANCQAALATLREQEGYAESLVVDSAFGSLKLGDIDAQCARSEKQASQAQAQAEKRTALAKKGSAKAKKLNRKTVRG